MGLVNMEVPQAAPLNVTEMLRVSSDKQDVQRQEYDTAENRLKHNLNVLRTIGIKVSGTLVETHPEVQQMLADLASPGVDAVSLSALDRLFRPKDYDGVAILMFFVKHRKVIISTKEGIIRPWDDAGWDICMGAAQKAGAYIRDLKRITKGGRRRTQAKQKMCYPTPPYGMVYVSKYQQDAEGRSQYLIEDPRPSSLPNISRKQVVQMVYYWRYALGARTSSIFKKLNKMGILTAGKKGQYEPGLWSRQTVIYMLKNRKYTGVLIEDGVAMPCPKFIEPEVFEAVQKMFKESKDLHNGRETTKYLLSGKLRCRFCGHRCNTKTQRATYRNGGWTAAYVCCSHLAKKLNRKICPGGEINTRLLETAIWSAIWAHLTDATLLLANARAYYDSLPSKNSTKGLEQRLAKLKTQVERMQQMVKLGTYDFDKGNQEILEGQQEMAAIRRDLQAAGSIITLPSVFAAKAGCERIVNPAVALETFEERRPILDKLVDLKMVWDGQAREWEVTGKVPVAEAVQASGSMQQKCKGSLTSSYSSTAYIPFKLKAKVDDALPPKRDGKGRYLKRGQAA